MKSLSPWIFLNYRHQVMDAIYLINLFLNNFIFNYRRSRMSQLVRQLAFFVKQDFFIFCKYEVCASRLAALAHLGLSNLLPIWRKMGIFVIKYNCPRQSGAWFASCGILPRFTSYLRLTSRHVEDLWQFCTVTTICL